jgi:beta-lactamase class A
MKAIGVLVAVFFLLYSAPDDTRRGPSVQELLEQKLLDRIHAIDDSVDGVLGVAVIDLSSSRTISWHGKTSFPQASSIKMLIIAELFRCAREGRLKLEDTVTVPTSDAVGGSGHLSQLLRKGPVSLTIADLAKAMIETSDNTATNRLISMVGMDRVNDLMDQLGLPNTRLRRIMMDTAAAAEDRENVSTPLEMARLVELIYRGKVVDAEASKAILDTLRLVRADFRAAIPASVPVASKPGELMGVRCETGVVLLSNRPFVLSVMSTYLSEGTNPVPEVAAIVYEHFVKLDASNWYGNRIR